MSPLLTRPLIIDSSHGFNNTKPKLFDPGAVNHRLNITEAEMTYALGIALEKYLRDDLGLPTYRIFNQPYSFRPKLANNVNGILFVSLEFNAGGGSGTECLHFPGSKEGERLAILLSHHVANALELRNRGPKTSTLYELRATRMPAATLEVCFVDNDKDVLTYQNKSGQIIRAISFALLRYLAGAKS